MHSPLDRMRWRTRRRILSEHGEIVIVDAAGRVEAKERHGSTTDTDPVKWRRAARRPCNSSGVRRDHREQSKPADECECSETRFAILMRLGEDFFDDDRQENSGGEREE